MSILNGSGIYGIKKTKLIELKEKRRNKNMKNKKNIITIICIIILAITIAVLLASFKFHNSVLNNSEKGRSSTKEIEINASPENLTIAKVLKENKEDKVFYVTSEYALGLEPTLDYLYKKSDIIVVGTFEKDSKSYVSEGTIRTKTTFNTVKVLKNDSKTDVSETVTFERLGGVMNLSDYLMNNISVRKDEFTNIDKNARSSYYVVQEFAPNNQLNFADTIGNKEYLLFLSYCDGVLMPNSVHYGIREISKDKVYDYDSKTYIDSKINEYSKE